MASKTAYDNDNTENAGVSRSHRESASRMSNFDANPPWKIVIT